MTTTVFEDGAYYTFGDTESATDTLDGKAKGQVINGIDGNGVINYIYGDAYGIADTRVGNDVLTGGNGFDAKNYLHGDAENMEGGRGGNDVLYGGNCFQNGLYGDAYTMKYDSYGGNDILTGGIAIANELFGDAYEMEKSYGGNDTLNAGGDFYNALFGDAFKMTQGSVGGNDALSGGGNAFQNVLYGDAVDMENSVGGNDVLIAGDNAVSGIGNATQNYLFGDAESVAGTIICGNDRLVSGTGKDEMWGDFSSVTGLNLNITTGHDVFVFYAHNGHDIIGDFEQGKDKIELQGLIVESFEQDGNDIVIRFDENNSVTVIGVSSLTNADFIFV